MTLVDARHGDHDWAGLRATTHKPSELLFLPCRSDDICSLGFPTAPASLAGRLEVCEILRSIDEPTCCLPGVEREGKLMGS